ncbi:hypothetical protein GE21DRAFT_1278021 [Neurospora crassa]|nr:hypothetical protein GE21DRAFT_1278021 [Neurospora crassa]
MGVQARPPPPAASGLKCVDSGERKPRHRPKPGRQRGPELSQLVGLGMPMSTGRCVHPLQPSPSLLWSLHLL